MSISLRNLAAAGALLLLVLAFVTPSYAAERPAQSLSDQTAAWLAERGFVITHTEVRDETELPEQETDRALSPGARWTALVRSDRPQEIFVRTPLLRRLNKLSAVRTRWDLPYTATDDIGTLIHEQLHQPARISRSTDAAWRDHLFIEEGAVEAVSVDLAPLFVKQRFGAKVLRETPSYPDAVSAVRYASARATGSKTWRTRAAFQWRVELVKADPVQRTAMLRAI
jgi:hypothetical protein